MIGKRTPLEEGIFVTITLDELEKLEMKKGYLSRFSYPDTYKKVAKNNEVGRFMIFRVLVSDDEDSSIGY